MRVIGLYHAIHLTVLREDNIVSGLAVARPKKAGCYSPAEGYWLRLLFPHLQRAFRIGRLLAQLQLDRELLSKAMNRLPQGALVVNAAGKVIYFNQAAQKILEANDGLSLNHEARFDLEWRKFFYIDEFPENAKRFDFTIDDCRPAE